MILKPTLENVVLTQKEKFKKKEKLIRRELNVNLQNKFAVIITGIRRCGKSTLMDLIAKNVDSCNYINFEDPRISDFQLSDFETLDEVFKKINGVSNYYFFDEIQLVDKWEFYIRYLLDMDKYVIITGSNASLLSKELGTKLTGRSLRYELFPFSYDEFLKYKKLKKGIKTFEKYLKQGGFPEFLLLEDAQILRNLVSDSLIRDIAIRHNIKNIKQLTEIAIYLISNVSKELSFNSLTKMFDLGSTNTTSKFISYLEDAYLLFTINKFDFSLKKQLVNPKKVYAIDTGLIIHNSKTFTKDFGRLLENLVFIELKRRGKEIFYFKENGECDFLTREGVNITSAIQVCYELTTQNKEREINGLLEALNKFDLEEGVILTLDQEQEFDVENKKIKILPVWKWL